MLFSAEGCSPFIRFQIRVRLDRLTRIPQFLELPILLHLTDPYGFVDMLILSIHGYLTFRGIKLQTLGKLAFTFSTSVDPAFSTAAFQR